MDGKFQRVRFRSYLDSSPVGNAVLVDCTHFERIRSLGFQSFKQEISVADGRVEHSVKLNFVEVGIGCFIPSRFQGVCFPVFFGYLRILRCCQGSGGYTIAVSRFKTEAFHVYRGLMGGNIGSSQSYTYLRILRDGHFLEFAAFCGKLVQIRSFFIPEDIFTFQEVVGCVHFCQFHCFAIYLG